MKKILILGKNGYISSCLKKYLDDYNIKFSLNKNDDKYIETEKISLKEYNLDEIDFSKYDVIFNGIGLAHIDIKKISEEQKDKYYKINTDFCEKIAKKCKMQNVKKLIQCSTINVYGINGKLDSVYVIDNKTMPNPKSVYANSKLQGENKIIENLNKNQYAIIRIPMVYGKESKGNFKKLVNIAKKIKIFPYIKNQRSCIYIENLCEFVRCIIINDLNGIFYPQNNEYINTSIVVQKISNAFVKKGILNREVILINGCNFLIKLLSHFTKKIEKAFGSVVYDKTVSNIGFDYNIVNLDESIERTIN